MSIVTAANADRIQIEETIDGADVLDWRALTNDKNVGYVNDQQNGNYSNQVSFDLTGLIQQNGMMSLQEGYVLMPMSTTIAASTAPSPAGTAVLTAPTAWTANKLNLKSNFINFVDSIQLFINGIQLIDQTSFSNFILNALEVMTISASNQKLVGSAYNIIPDTTTSQRYSGPNATVNGDGYTNGIYLPSAAATTLTSLDYKLMNNGLAQRNTMFNTPAATGSGVNGTPPALSSTVNNFTQTLQPYFSEANASSLAVEGTWNYVVCLPLAKLSDLLAKMPLIGGSQIRLVINFNAGTTTITTDTTATNALLKMTSYSATAGQTNPILLSSNYINPITSTASAGTILLKTQIQTQAVARVSTTTAQKGYASLPQCRLYCPSYKINPSFNELIIKNRIKTIRYNDWYQQPILGVVNGSSFSNVLTTAQANVQQLVILPFQSSGTSLFSTFGGSQFQSCFDTAPATTMPGGMLAFQNFNVSVSGENVFTQNQNYGYDNWLQEVLKVGLSAGLNKELSSGLWDKTTWEWSPFIVVDISRRAESVDKSYQSVVVSGTNNSGVSVDYYCFISFQKEIEIDVITGAVKRNF